MFIYIWDVFGFLKLVYLESRHLKSAAAPELNLGCAPWNINELRMNGSEKKSEKYFFFLKIWLFSPVASAMILQLVRPIELLLLAKGPDYVHLTLLWNWHWRFDNWKGKTLWSQAKSPSRWKSELKKSKTREKNLQSMVSCSPSCTFDHPEQKFCN